MNTLRFGIEIETIGQTREVVARAIQRPVRLRGMRAVLMPGRADWRCVPRSSWSWIRGAPGETSAHTATWRAHPVAQWAGALGFGRPGCGHLVDHRPLWIESVPRPGVLAGACAPSAVPMVV